jgi:uncharacterized membrane protein YfcA
MMTLASWLGMAATSFLAAVLLTTNGFGFAVLAVPFFLLFAPPGEAIQVTIILSSAISLVVLPSLHRDVEWPLLRRLTIGSLAGLPLGLAAFAYAEPAIVRAVAGAVIASFAAAQAYNHYHQRPPSLVMHPVGDLVAGAAAGAATGLVGMPGPPVVIYLIMVGAPAQMSRSTQIAFFALIFATTLAANAAFRGVPRMDWAIAASLIPLTALGAWVGMHIGNRLDDNAAAILAIVVLGAAGLYTLAAALHTALW